MCVYDIRNHHFQAMAADDDDCNDDDVDDDDDDGWMHALPVGDAALDELARVAANGDRISCDDDDIMDWVWRLLFIKSALLSLLLLPPPPVAVWTSIEPPSGPSLLP